MIHAAKYVKSQSEDLLRELNALQSLRNCEFVLQFVAFYKSTTRIHSILVTEFLAGGDLLERTSAPNYVLTEEKCRNIVRQITRGVQFIHSRRFIHLDLKPFNIVFSKKRDDFDLRIIDFGLARELGEAKSVRTGMCGTIEYMSPEVMNCADASTASDMWGVGCITYQLLSGGISPFFAVNRFRTMARVLDCDYSLDAAELSKTSSEAKDFISMLLIKEPGKRMSADRCLSHAWLRDDHLYLGILQTLETSWMRRCLARRRWYRLFNAVRVMTRIAHLNNLNCDSSSCEGGSTSSAAAGKTNGHATPGDMSEVMGSSCEDEDLAMSAAAATPAVFNRGTGMKSSPSLVNVAGHGQPIKREDTIDFSQLSDLPPFVHDISTYYHKFEKLHLIVNNGVHGTVFSVQRTSVPQLSVGQGSFGGKVAAFESNGHFDGESEVYSARHVKHCRDGLRIEAGILYQLRNAEHVVQLEGLYDGLRQSVLVTDFLCGGDLCERVSSPNFILNESKCKRFVKQICQGLEYIHKNNILHLDIKPFSVFFVDPEPDSDLKISDFNLARRLSLSAKDGDPEPLKLECMSGTIEFMSPEMVECSAATFATDCWGVGVIAFMLITGGKSPFYAGSRFKTIARILSCQYGLETLPELAHISSEAKAFIRNLMTSDPRRRLSASQCLEHPWLSTASLNDTLYTMETRWMKKLLARRRWHRWFNAVRAAQRIRKLSVMAK